MGDDFKNAMTKALMGMYMDDSERPIGANMFVDSFRSIQELIHNIAKEEGKRSYGEYISMMYCDLSELIKVLLGRYGIDTDSASLRGFKAIEEKLADVIIRIMEFSGAENLDVAGAIVAKAKKREHILSRNTRR